MHIVTERRKDLGKVDLRTLARLSDDKSGDVLVAVARIMVALADPVIATRVPKLTFDWRITFTSQRYGDQVNGTSVSHAQVTFILSNGSSSPITQEWSPAPFPKRVTRRYVWNSAGE